MNRFVDMTPEETRLLEEMAKMLTDLRNFDSLFSQDTAVDTVRAILRVFVERTGLGELGSVDSDNPHLLTLGVDEDGAFNYAEDFFYTDEFLGKALLQLLKFSKIQDREVHGDPGSHYALCDPSTKGES